jgi:hypothetical protein
MIPTDKDNMRTAIESAAPVKVRLHGSPANAPSIEARGCGFAAFRSWGRLYVEVAPLRPLTEQEADTLAGVLRYWEGEPGRTYQGGPDGWPFVVA